MHTYISIYTYIAGCSGRASGEEEHVHLTTALSFLLSATIVTTGPAYCFQSSPSLGVLSYCQRHLACVLLSATPPTMELPGSVILPEPSLAVLTGVAAYLLYFVGLVIYRLYFSPIARFPGPKIAAATGWYEFYYDCWLNGKYIFEIEAMHKKYGKHKSTSLYHYRRTFVLNSVYIWMY